ncbi:protein kinase domain-containing protein [Arthrobacter globiformis]|uniref:protein kinase domain-containing protein n=1 Tax=Arthrobacter globiformis TaxID=1665 RepID=UPI00397CBEA7
MTTPESHGAFMDGSAGEAPAVAGYSACRRLGRGGSAEVWLVSQDSTGAKLALKCFRRPPGGGELGGSGLGSGGLGGGELGSDEPGSGSMAREEGLRRELLIMSVLDHEHLVKAYGVVRLDEPDRTDEPGRTDGQGKAYGAGECSFGLLMDYAPGGSLQELVTARRTLSVGETVTVLTPIAQVLGYLHGKGFTHSDVAPGNVLFTAHGKPLLADLGVARMVGDASGVPDQHTGGFADPAPVDAVRAGLQPERDVYAAAALGWYCLTGQPPPPSAARPPLSLLVPDVPSELAAALEAGLSDDRRQRPAAAEFATAVYRSAAAVPVDLSRSVHGTVLPELLTRRPVPPSGGRLKKRLLAWGRRLKTTGWVRALARLSLRGELRGDARGELTAPAAAPPDASVRAVGDRRGVRQANAGPAADGDIAVRDTAVGRTARRAAAGHAVSRNSVVGRTGRRAAAGHAADRDSAVGRMVGRGTAGHAADRDAAVGRTVGRTVGRAAIRSAAVGQASRHSAANRHSADSRHSAGWQHAGDTGHMARRRAERRRTDRQTPDRHASDRQTTENQTTENQTTDRLTTDRRTRCRRAPGAGVGALPTRVRRDARAGPGGSRRLAVTGGVLTAAVLAAAGLLGFPGAAQESGQAAHEAGQAAQESVREAQNPAPAARDAGQAALEAVLPAGSPRPAAGAVARAAALPGDVRRRLASEDPVVAVLGLAQLRSLALREGRLDLLDDVNAPNTPAHAADQRIRAGLEKSATVLAGFTTSLYGVRRLPGSTAARAVVAVTSSTSAYEERSAGGAVTATGVPQQDVRLRLVLVMAEGRWRIADILPPA